MLTSPCPILFVGSWDLLERRLFLADILPRLQSWVVDRLDLMVRCSRLGLT